MPTPPEPRRNLLITGDCIFIGENIAAPVSRLQWTLRDLALFQWIQIQTHKRDPRKVACIVPADKESRDREIMFLSKQTVGRASAAALNKQDVSVGQLAFIESMPLVAMAQDAIFAMAESNGENYPYDTAVHLLAEWGGKLFDFMPSVSDFEQALAAGYAESSVLFRKAGWGAMGTNIKSVEMWTMGRYQVRVRYLRAYSPVPENIQITYVDHGKVEVPVLNVKGDAAGFLAAARVVRLIQQSVLAFIAYHARLGVTSPVKLGGEIGVVIPAAPVYNCPERTSGWFVPVANGFTSASTRSESLFVLADGRHEWSGVLQAVGALMIHNGLYEPLYELRDSFLLAGIDHGPHSLYGNYEAFTEIPAALLDSGAIELKSDGYWVAVNMPGVRKSWGPFPLDAVDLVVNFALSNSAAA